MLDDDGIPDFLKRPFPDEGQMTDGVETGKGGSQQTCQPAAPPAELSPAEEFRAKNPYTERDLEVIAQLNKEQEQSSKATTKPRRLPSSPSVKPRLPNKNGCGRYVLTCADSRVSRSRSGTNE